MARPSRSKAPPSPGSCSATRAPASSGCRSACSSGSPGWRPAITSSAARAGWTAAPRSGLLGARGRGPGHGAGSPAITFEWYRTFLQTLLDNKAYTWFAPLITFGEMAVGIGLLVGCLTGFAAFFGALMNMSFLLAGSASVNPVLFTLADRADPRLEGRRLLRRRPLPPPDARHPVASGSHPGATDTTPAARRRPDSIEPRGLLPARANPRPPVRPRADRGRSIHAVVLSGRSSGDRRRRQRTARNARIGGPDRALGGPDLEAGAFEQAAGDRAARRPGRAARPGRARRG